MVSGVFTAEGGGKAEKLPEGLGLIWKNKNNMSDRSTKSKERRHFSRVDFQSVVIVGIRGGEFQAELIDISLKRALIILETDLSLGEGEQCTFELKLDENVIAVKTDALIVFSQESQLELKFKNLELESMIHSRRLIELNLGDPDKIQQELFFLVNPMQEV
ncbi:MAG: PilZ domain-containing protein [SAR324 cluster bacterium]|nr:PilZ domain-containing protein [SAR324 cluster bacterium]